MRARTHRAGGVDELQDALAGDDRAARLDQPCAHCAVDRTHEARLCAQLAHARDVGLRARTIALRGFELRGCRFDSSAGRPGFVAAGVQGFLAHEPARMELRIAPRARVGELCAASRFRKPRLRRALGIRRARRRETPAGDPIVEVDRIELGEQLPGLHGVALVHQYAQHAAWHRRPEHIRAPGFDGADAERGGDERTLLDRRDRHSRRRERPLRRHEPRHQCGEAGAGGDQDGSAKMTSVHRAFPRR